jgi:hypothetical protein
MPVDGLRFLVPSPERLGAHAADRVYMAGYDQVPWPCRVRWCGTELVIERDVSDSGKVYIPWSVNGHGELTLCTATLMVRKRPYHAVVELARGKLNQVRNQAAAWAAEGLAIPPEFEQRLQRAQAHFSQAATRQDDPAAAAVHAEQAIVEALAAGETLVAAFAKQSLALRIRHWGRLPLLLSVRLPAQPLSQEMQSLAASCSRAANVALVWRDVEQREGGYQWDVFDSQVQWCAAAGLRLHAGPLIQLDELGVPDWLWLWEGDFDNLSSCVIDYVETAVNRYRGKVDLWHVAARVNAPHGLALSEEDCLRLTARAVDAAHRTDPHTPVVVRFDQPWAEYMGRSGHELSPLHFADALVRAGISLGGIGLELNLGYYPCGSSLRDRLELNRLIDLWSLLGLPLHVFLTVPADGSPDPHARRKCQPLPATGPGWNAQTQAEWAQELYELLLAKSYVQSITWNQLTDAGPHELPHAGLIDPTGKPRPALDVLARWNQELPS